VQSTIALERESETAVCIFEWITMTKT